MLTIGLAGGSGSGKGTASGLFLAFGIESIDTDAVYHELTSVGGACISPLVEVFGSEILHPDGSLNRTALSKIVFASDNAAENKKKLDGITHKTILERVRVLLADARERGVAAVLVDAPLLFESGFDRECDLVISVIADKKTRISRIMERDGISEYDAIRRIDSQLPDEYLVSHSDFIINNTGSAENMAQQVAKIAENILKRGK